MRALPHATPPSLMELRACAPTRLPITQAKIR